MASCSLRTGWLAAAFILTAVAIFAGCAPPPSAIAPVVVVTATAEPSPTAVPSPTRTPRPEPEGTRSPSQIGPDNFPPDINPLTGLPVDDPDVLRRRPLLIKVSNESSEVRPQSGLSFADHVWEHIMEDKRSTRYTAIYLSQAPAQVGSVRSARLIDVDHLVLMYQGIFALSGGSLVPGGSPPGSPPRIRELLQAAPYAARVVSQQEGFYEPYFRRIPDIPYEGVPSYHSLFANPEAIWAWADNVEENAGVDLYGLTFDQAIPGGGIATRAAVVDFPAYGPTHRWVYDADLKKWESWTDGVQDQDYLTGDLLVFDNVVILGARHVEANFIEDEPRQFFSLAVDLHSGGPAILLRDGQRFEATWRRYHRSLTGMIELVDQAGKVLPFKPGTVWYSLYMTNYPDFVTDVEFDPEE